MLKYKQSLSTVQSTQNIINIWSSFHHSRMCALQFYSIFFSYQRFSGAHRTPGVCSCKAMLGWEFKFWGIRFSMLFIHVGAMLFSCTSSDFSKEENWEIPPVGSWIPILQHYITLILVSALQQDESGRYLALFLSHHHSVMVDLAGWNEDFRLLLPLMSLSEASNSHAPCGCSGLLFREWKTVPSSG